MEEKNYYSDNSISVTSTRVMIGSTTYSLRNVSSVRTMFTAPSHIIDILLIITGVISLIIGFAMIKNSGGFCVGIGVLLGIIGVIVFKSKKNTYYVLLGTNAGEHKALTSTNQQYIDTIVTAINNAIIEYK
ncbi:MAG TPA: DUF6232 family protein [Ignavibacteria bacterium]|nr:DUF6232 family protein [Ignavibacteria bacterium]HMR00391.1 DUF6232 family protein [Ignavibacteria bacterium]